MKLLLDTHALLWWLGDDPTLSTAARSAIANGQNMVAVSAATTWEISIKLALGKLSAPADLEERTQSDEFESLPITLDDGFVAGKLPRHHNDPFDRMLVAQAHAGNFTLVTRDTELAQYGIDVLPA